MKYLTDREIHVAGIQRTGQHAVTSWLVGHFEDVCFKNSMSQRGERDSKAGSLKPPWWYFKPSEREQWIEDANPNIQQGMDAIMLGTEFTLPGIGVNPLMPQQRDELAKLSSCDKLSERSDCVVILRNPYNHYASVLNWNRNKRLRSPQGFSNVWIALAKEAGGETDYLSNEYLPITHERIFLLYDRWFESQEYRQGISERLGLKFNDRRINTVMRIGVSRQYGSSFDGMQYQKSGQKMDVLNRWKQVEDDDRFQELLRNDELRHYASQNGFEI